MVIRIVKMALMRKIAPLRKCHHRRRLLLAQLVTIGCINAVIIDACHIGGNAMASMIAAMVPMNWAVRMPLMLLHPRHQSSPQSSHALATSSRVPPVDASNANTFATDSQTVRMEKMRRIVRRIFVVATNSSKTVMRQTNLEFSGAYLIF